MFSDERPARRRLRTTENTVPGVAEWNANSACEVDR